MGSPAQKNKPPFLRIEVTLDNCADGAEQRETVESLRRFFAEASGRLYQRCEVVQVDTAQIFHEKTDFLSLRTLPENRRLWPKKLQALDREMQKGRYEVAAPGDLEQNYYEALRGLIRDIRKNDTLPDMQGMDEPLHMGQLQQFYTRYLKDLPQDAPLRNTEAFRQFAAVRADCGEQAMAERILHRSPAEAGEKVISLFVSLDRGALELVAEAGKTAENQQGGSFQSHAVHPRGFADLAQQLVQSMKSQYPECADIPFSASKSHAAAHIARAMQERVVSGQSR